ncbi:MAG: M4 family metallopeptidase, partial [Pirellulaceae bacterium]|nr:M4 family metallopeptidase [Pirellulaceae bacterium]
MARFETLEPRNMLAADFGIADPYSSSLLTHVGNDTPVAQQVDVLRNHLGADASDSFELLNQTQDQIGFEHFKYQHLYKGYPVENSTYTVHTRDGLIISLSGEYHDVDAAIANVTLNQTQALQSAMDFVGAQHYIWQVGATQLLGGQGLDIDPQDSDQTDHGSGCHCGECLGLGMQQDPSQHDHGSGCQCASCMGGISPDHNHQHDFLTHAAHDHDLGISLETPDGELVYLNNTLAYKFDIYATTPMSRSWVFVDATSGTVIATENRIHDVNVPASGTTLYDANQAFTADFSGADYRLRQSDAAGPPQLGGVETYDLNEGTNYGNAVDFVSNSQNFGQPDHEVGNQTHWGTDKTWEYFFNQHERDSWDGAGATLVSYTSYRSNYLNAFWNGSFMTYGDGDGNLRGPLVSLDIVGHEVTHGVVQSTAGLIYRNQSGALNESFADIFGEAVENHARNNNDWLMGGDIGLNGNSGQFRNMQNPNQFADPDTYLGDYWYVGNGDAGGVHINSGVMNKWFYIMSVGEAGTNDTGHTYNVAAVGIDDAADIAYRNLSVYLTANSTYPDARVGAVQSAIDLFGVGSQQHLSTMAAWDAVGVYSLTEEFVLTPVQPMGSQVYTANAINEIQFDSDVREFDLPLDANQKITLMVGTMTGDLVPRVTITNPTGLVLANFTASSSSEAIFIENLPAVEAGEYTISVEGDAATTGQFEAKLWMNAGLELESLGLGPENNSAATAQDIDATHIVQGHLPVSAVDRLAVLGEL